MAFPARKPASTHPLTLAVRRLSLPPSLHMRRRRSSAAMEAQIIVYSKEGEEGVAHPIQSTAGSPVFTIGRAGAVSLIIGEPHISAQQAAIFAPVPDKPTWRLIDTSTNGTSVNNVPVGKNNEVPLLGGEKICFSIRAYPYAVFHRQRPNETSAAEEVRSNPPSSKRRRASANGAPAASEADLAAAKSTLEKQVGVQAKELKRLNDELTAAQQAAETAQGRVGAMEALQAEGARTHTSELATRDEQVAQAARAAAHEAREAQRVHAAELDAATAKSHALEQRLATADEAAASAQASLATAKEEAASEVAQRQACETREAEVREQLAAAVGEKDELAKRLTAASEAEATAKREAARLAASLEGAQRSAKEHEEMSGSLRVKLEEVRAEAAALHADKLTKGEELRSMLDDASEKAAAASEWRRKYEELRERAAADASTFADERKKLTDELSEARAAHSRLMSERNESHAHAADTRAKYSTLLSDAQTSLASLARLAADARALSEHAQRARDEAHAKMQYEGASLSVASVSPPSTSQPIVVSQAAGAAGDDAGEEVAMTQKDVRHPALARCEANARALHADIRGGGHAENESPQVHHPQHGSSQHHSSQGSAAGGGGGLSTVGRSPSSAGGPTQAGPLPGSLSASTLRPQCLFLEGSAAGPSTATGPARAGVSSSSQPLSTSGSQPAEAHPQTSQAGEMMGHAHSTQSCGANSASSGGGLGATGLPGVAEGGAAAIDGGGAVVGGGMMVVDDHSTVPEEQQPGAAEGDEETLGGEDGATEAQSGGGKSAMDVVFGETQMYADDEESEEAMMAAAARAEALDAATCEASAEKDWVGAETCPYD